MDPKKISDKALIIFSIVFILFAAAFLTWGVLEIIDAQGAKDSPKSAVIEHKSELFRKGQMINAYLSGYIRAQKDLLEHRNFNDSRALSLYLDSCAEADILKLKDE